MRGKGENDNVNQCDNAGLTFVTNNYTATDKVEQETFDYNVIILFLQGKACIDIPGTGSHKVHQEELIFIPSQTTFHLDISKDCKVLEIRFKEINNLFCGLFFKFLTSLCHDITYRFAPIASCSAMREYAEKIMATLNDQNAEHLTQDYELFVILGVYYPRSMIANFLYPYLLKTK